MLRWLSRFLPQLHSWDYRNPHDRTCSKCGLNQNRFAASIVDDGWWEDMNSSRRAAPCNPAEQRAQAQKEQSK